MTEAKFKCRKHPRQYKTRICLEKNCYCCLKFDVELCEKCHRLHHQDHDTVPFQIFLEYLKMGVSRLKQNIHFAKNQIKFKPRIEQLESNDGREMEIQDIYDIVDKEIHSRDIPLKQIPLTVIQSRDIPLGEIQSRVIPLREIQSRDIPLSVTQSKEFLLLEESQSRDVSLREIPLRIDYLFEEKKRILMRVKEFEMMRINLLKQISLKLRLLRSDKRRIFSSRKLFHFARDLFLGLRMQQQQFQSYSSEITSNFKKELLKAITFVKQYHLQQNYKIESKKIKDDTAFQMQMETEDGESIEQCEKYPSKFRSSRGMEVQNLQGVQIQQYKFERECQQPSYYAQRMFKVGLVHVAYQCAQHLYYYNTANNSVETVLSIAPLFGMRMMVEELNEKEICVHEKNKLRVVCKITGATLASHAVGNEVTLIRALNSSQIAYFTQYIVTIWDTRSRMITNVIKLNLLDIQDIIEISPNRVCIGANDNFLFIYDTARNKLLRKLDTENIQRDKNINCDNLIFTKLRDNYILTSFCGSNYLYLWNLSAYKCTRIIQLRQTQVYSVVRLNSHTLALGSINSFHFLNILSGEIIRSVSTKNNNNPNEDSTPELIRCIYAHNSTTLITLSQLSIKIFN